MKDSSKVLDTIERVVTGTKNMLDVLTENGFYFTEKEAEEENKQLEKMLAMLDRISPRKS